MNLKDYSKPVRPPRSGKNPKDTSAYLMKIIHTLSISQDNSERDRQKELLEKEFNDSDRLLARLVKSHTHELNKVFPAFTKCSASLQGAISTCQEMREKLTRCKTLLYCSSEELKRLWLEVVEHRKVMLTLKEIENMMSVPIEIERFLKSGKYLCATKLLVISISLFEDGLNGIDALKELKLELYSRREALYDILVKELHVIIYTSASNNILSKFKRHGSGRFKHNEIDEMNTSNTQTNCADRDLNESASSMNSWIDGTFSDEECLIETVRDSPTENAIESLVECLSLLNRIPETIEVFKERSQQEMLTITRRTAQHVSETSQNVVFTYQQSYIGCVHSKEQQNVLHDLLELIFEQFKIITHSQKILVQNFQKNRNETENDPTYEIVDIWSILQSVLEIFITEYVDIRNTSVNILPTPFSKVTATVDISSFFTKKKNPKPKNFSLFKFDRSSHAISMKTYLQEQRAALKEAGEIDSFDSETQVFICPPAIKNIVFIYNPLTKFLTDVASQLELVFSENCPFQFFISRCIKVFLSQITMEVSLAMETVQKSLHGWIVAKDPETLKKAGVSIHLLNSAVFVHSRMMEIRELIHALPLNAHYFLNTMCNMLQCYTAECQNAYNNIVQSQAFEPKRIISAAWAKDTDISRLLRSLPNWTNLKEKDCPDVEESPEEIRLRNKKESEILTANLSGDVLISENEILFDSVHLYNLSLLHESLEWLATNTLEFSKCLPIKNMPDQSYINLRDADEDDPDPVPDVTVESLTKIVNEMRSLADTCLLVLHLEVRVHSFFYLQPLAVQGFYSTRVDSQEPDPEITKLNHDLSKLDELFQYILKPCNIKYVFEGLGELIAIELINSVNRIKRINENGVKKINRNIFALQQNLTGITMSREVALDRARQYFDLLNHSPEEILNLIVENGPQFTEHEYSAVFQLLQRSQPGSDSNAINTHFERLHQILNEVAVSV